MRKLLRLALLGIARFLAIGTAYNIWQKHQRQAQLDSCPIKESARLLEKEQQHIPFAEMELQWLERCLAIGRAEFKRRHPELHQETPTP